MLVEGSERPLDVRKLLVVAEDPGALGWCGAYGAVEVDGQVELISESLADGVRVGNAGMSSGRSSSFGLRGAGIWFDSPHHPLACTGRQRPGHREVTLEIGADVVPIASFVKSFHSDDDVTRDCPTDVANSQIPRTWSVEARKDVENQVGSALAFGLFAEQAHLIRRSAESPCRDHDETNRG